MNVAQFSLSLPPEYSRVRVVTSLHELVTTPFSEGVNALCWERVLEGNFAEVVEKFASTEDITVLDENALEKLRLSLAGRTAAGVLAEDLHRLRSLGLSPALECIRNYPRDDVDEAVPTDVYSFHVDSATVATDTYLCSYTESSSEGLSNDEAQRCVEVPETRAALLKLYGGQDDADFAEYLNGNCYDLHYIAKPFARPFSFGLGNLWRIAVEYPGCPVPPCVHRAPETIPGRPPRLLLIS